MAGGERSRMSIQFSNVEALDRLALNTLHDDRALFLAWRCDSDNNREMLFADRSCCVRVVRREWERLRILPTSGDLNTPGVLAWNSERGTPDPWKLFDETAKTE